MAFGKIITISGLTGVGKSYIKDYLLNNLENTEPATNVTTRLKESDRETASFVEYVSEDEFQRRYMLGELCGIRESNGAWCGFKTEEFEKTDDGINLIVDISCDGLEEIKDDFGNVISIYVLPKDLSRVKKELQERYPNPEVYKKKLQEIKEEMKFYEEHGHRIFNITVKNDFTEQTCKKLKESIEEKMYGRPKEVPDRDD